MKQIFIHANIDYQVILLKRFVIHTRRNILAKFLFWKSQKNK